jgi:hypothetical protein
MARPILLNYKGVYLEKLRRTRMSFHLSSLFAETRKDDDVLKSNENVICNGSRTAGFGCPTGAVFLIYSQLIAGKTEPT